MKNTLIKWLGGYTIAEVRQFRATEDVTVNRLRNEHAAIVKRLSDERDIALREYERTVEAALVADQALREIAEAETPAANGTVRRMARIAREALDRRG